MEVIIKKCEKCQRVYQCRLEDKLFTRIQNCEDCVFGGGIPSIDEFGNRLNCAMKYYISPGEGVCQICKERR